MMSDAEDNPYEVERTGWRKAEPLPALNGDKEALLAHLRAIANGSDSDRVRLAALAEIGRIEGHRAKQDLGPVSGCVMVVPYLLNKKEWQAVTMQQQRELKEVANPKPTPLHPPQAPPYPRTERPHQSESPHKYPVEKLVPGR